MIVVTGAAGFIGSAFASYLNHKGQKDLLLVDAVNSVYERRYLRELKYTTLMSANEFLSLLKTNQLPQGIEGVVHLGASSSTTVMNEEYLERVNTAYTKALCLYCLEKGIRFIYASSGATYGDGKRGFSDSDVHTPWLKPLNPYGRSKQRFDTWALERGLLDHIAGFKFFNVYGPNEYHKDDMASMIFKAYLQVQSTGKVRLFRSFKEGLKDGEQVRDFIYIRDCVEVLHWFLENPKTNGLFNLGLGVARTWNDLAAAVFEALGRPRNIEYFDMPDALRTHYQNYTCAEMDKLRATGCPMSFASLEEGVKDYVQNYLVPGFRSF